MRIEEFRREHDLLRGTASSLYAEQLTAVNQQLASARAAQAEATAQLDQMTDGAADAPVTLQSRAINDIKQEITRVKSNPWLSQAFISLTMRHLSHFGDRRRL